MQLDWAIHTSPIQKRLSIVTNQSTIYDFTLFLWLRITIIALLFQLILYYSTCLVSNIGHLLLVLIFWFRILERGWFCMLVIIASNFWKIRNSWTIVEKYAPTVVSVGAHFFAQFLENCRSHSNACNALISSKKHATVKFERDW